MKKIALGLMSLVLGLSVMAQTPDKTNDPSVKKERRSFKVNDKYEKLNLTDDQKTQVKELNAGLKKDLADLNSQTLTPEEKKTKKIALLKDHREKMKGLLTDEQRKEAKQLKEQYKGGKNATGAQGQRMNAMVKDLNLSDDQSAKVKSLNGEVATTLKGIKENTSLTEDQKKEQTKVVLKKHREDLQNILTQEQRDKLRSKLKNGRMQPPVTAN